MRSYRVGEFHSDGDELIASFGQPHYVETDPLYCAGPEENWAWELASGHRILVALYLPVQLASLYCDPPEAAVAVHAPGIDRVKQQLNVYAVPFDENTP